MRKMLFALLLLAGCSDGGMAPAPPRPPSSGKASGEMINASWQFQYSPGMPRAPTKGTTGWYFDFPKIDGVHYLVTGITGLLPGMTQIILDYEVTTTGSPVFEYHTAANNTCPSPLGNVSLYMQRQGDDLSGDGDYANYRYWSRPLLSELKAGPATLTVPLTSDQWINVWGTHTNMAAAIANLQAIGMTFGGGCFAGHGVFVTGGTARFTAKSYQVK